MSNYIAKDVRCPYYCKEKGEKICCKGEAIDDDVYLHIIFKSPEERLNYQLDYCCDAFDLCPIAQANNEIWEDG